tara:strand:+ start:935 stop:1144 length:210 start_codon:yes stop_codon:yes gene_type:complete
MAIKENVAGIERAMTSKEESDFNNLIKTNQEDMELELNQKTKVDTDRTSGKKKLKDLGLTDDEIFALIG